MKSVDVPSVLIGIFGPRGAGKDTVGDYCETKGIGHISLSTLIRELATVQGRPQDRPTLIETAREARERSGGDVFVRLALERWLEQPQRWLAGLAISGHFTLEEATAIQLQGGDLWCVNADDESRLLREQMRARVDAPVTIDELRAQEEIERKGLAGPNTPNLEAVVSLPGVIAVDNNSSHEHLYEQIDKLLMPSE